MTPAMEDLAREVRDMVTYRASARQTVSQMMGLTSQMEYQTRGLEELGLHNAAKVRGLLQELYSAAGGLLNELAPHKDPDPPEQEVEPAPLSAEPVKLPDDDDETDEQEVLHAAEAVAP